METRREPGTYVLVMELGQATRMTIGGLGIQHLGQGYYLYVGSAMGGLRGRVARHLRKDKRLHWHIDYLLRAATVVEVWYRVGPERLECAWAGALRRSGRVEAVVRGFGASDCRCWGHLFFSKERPERSIVLGGADIGVYSGAPDAKVCDLAAR